MTTHWGFIGCGAVTEVKSGPAYQNTKDFEVVAVMRRNLVAAEDYAKRHGIARFYGDANELINDPNVDAVYIATPPDTHCKYALMVAKAGKICCIEKPLAPSYAESKQIVSAFDEAKVPLFVAYYRRSLPRFTKLKSLLEAGVIGDLRHIDWHLTKAPSAVDLSRVYNWRTDATIAKGGYFDDLASHGLDLFAFLLGDFEHVRGICTNQMGLYSAYDAISACWSHRSGVLGTGYWNFGAKERRDRVTVLGSEGTIEFSVFDEEPLKVVTHSGTETFVIDNPVAIQSHHTERMRAELAGESKHPSTGWSAMHTSWVMDQILRA